MHGLVSLLPSPYYEEVEKIWQELEFDSGLSGIKVTPYPHFSWQIAEHYDFEELERRIVDICGTVHSMVIRTSGLGLFSGDQPVIYIPVVKNRMLLRFHADIWQATQGISHGLSEYYCSDYWMPHISLAYTDVNRTNIAGIMNKLAFQKFEWEMVIDNLSLIYEPDGETGRLKFSAKFNTTDEVAISR